MNKQTFKKIGSVFAACAVLASSLSVTAFAQDTETSSGIDYLINETFDDLQNGGNGGDNDRISKWRIEGGVKGWNEYPSSTEMSVEASVTDDTNTMTNALKLASNVRGGRGWTEDKYIQPGETLTVEYEIMATEDAKFIFNITSEKRVAAIEDSAGDSTIFFINPNNEKIYYYAQTQRDDSSARAFNNVKFKHNEINKVKAEYKINDPATVGTTDTLTLTVTNSEGTKSETVYPNYRHANQWAAGVTAIRGIGFFKEDKTSTVYLDNIKAYKAPVDTSKYYFFKEGFDTFTKDDIRQNGTGATDSRWRIEGGDNQGLIFGDEGQINVCDFGGKTNALKLATSDYALRGGKKLDKAIGNKESYTIDLDLYVSSNNDQFYLSHVGTINDEGEKKDNDNIEDWTNSYYFILWSDNEDDNIADDTNIYYPQNVSPWYGGTSHADRNNHVYKTEEGENLKFKRGEWNHITIEYNYTDSNYITLTVDNATYGKQVSAPVKSTKSTIDKLENGLKGIAFYKKATTTDVYMDNLEVSRENVTLPTINRFTTTNADADVESSSVQVEFNQKMNEDSVEKIHIMTEEGTVLDTTAVLDEEGKVYTLTGNFERGAEYKIVVPATVVDHSGVAMSQTTAYKFVPSTAETTMTVDKVTTNVGDGSGSFKSLKASAIVSSDRVGKPMKIIIAAYDANDKLTGVLIKNVSSATAKANVYTPEGQRVSGGKLWGTQFDGIMINGAVKYKVFLWDDIQALVGNASGNWN